MRKIITAFAMAVFLTVGACSTIGAVTQPVPAPTALALQDAAYKAKLGFQATLVLSVAYIERPRCGRPTSPVLCSEQSTVDTMRKVIIATDSATQAAEDAARAIKSDTTVAAALVNAAERSVVALKTITPSK